MTHNAIPTVDTSPVMGPANDTRDGSSPSWVRRIAGTPLVHFSLLGVLVFVGHWRLTAGLEPPTIELSSTRLRELTKLFEQRNNRAPDDAERNELIRRYVADEVLFREGLRLSLVETDPVLREQVIARVSSLLRPEPSPTPTDAELKRYYEEHRADFALSETVAYREYWIQRGPKAGADARRLIQALQAEDDPGKDLPAASDQKARSEVQLLSLYDEPVARAIWALRDDQWHEFRSERGIHIVRQQGRTPGVQLAFADVRDQLESSYRRDQAERAFRAELDKLTAQWRVRVAEEP